MNIFDEEYAAYDEVDGEEIGDDDEGNEWAVSSCGTSISLYVCNQPLFVFYTMCYYPT